MKDNSKNVQLDRDRIIDAIVLESESYVLTQILYDSGWKVFANNKEISVIKSKGGFLQ